MTDARTDNNQQPHEEADDESIVHTRKSVDDVWKEIVGARSTSCKQEPPDPPHEMMTLEDFLAKAQAQAVPPPQQQDDDDDVKLPLPTLSLPLPSQRSSLLLSGSGSGGIFSFDHQPSNVSSDGLGVGVGVGRGKRRAILEPLDKAAQQRQRRMIKNRESAARSRERKQAYQAELESLALKLEEENETLLKAKTEQARKRYNQLMENIIPVTERRKSTRYVLRKVRSMEW